MDFEEQVWGELSRPYEDTVSALALIEDGKGGDVEVLTAALEALDSAAKQLESAINRIAAMQEG